VPRYHLRSGLLGTVIKELLVYTSLYLLCTLLLLVALLMAIFFRTWWPLVGAVSVGGIIFVGFWVKKRSLSETFKSLLLQTAVAYSAVRGFLMKPRPPETYPTEVEIVQGQVQCEER